MNLHQLLRSAPDQSSDAAALISLLTDNSGLIEWTGPTLTTLPWRIGMDTEPAAPRPLNAGPRWQRFSRFGSQQPHEFIPATIEPQLKEALIWALRLFHERDVRDDPGHHDAVRRALIKLGEPNLPTRPYSDAGILIRASRLFGHQIGGAQDILYADNARAIGWALRNDDPIQENLGQLCELTLTSIQQDRILTSRAFRRRLPHEQIEPGLKLTLHRGSGQSLIARDGIRSWTIELGTHHWPESEV